MSSKNGSPLGKFFWHHSAQCKDRLLAKCPNRWFELINGLTARFRISGHDEKQLTGETTKRFGDIKVTLRMTMIEIVYVMILSPIWKEPVPSTRKVEHKWCSLFLRKVYTKCVSDEIFNLHHLFWERVYVSM